jgi:hypothetical protein
MIMALAFLALGILGITDLVPMFKSSPVYINIVEIVLGGLGLLAGVFASRR